MEDVEALNSELIASSEELLVDACPRSAAERRGNYLKRIRAFA